MDIKTGYFQSDGNATNIILGFVPDFVRVMEDMEGTNGSIIEWSRSYSLSGLTDVHGTVLTGSSGVVTRAAAAANGIKAFDSSGDYVMVESPIPGVGNKATAVQVWAVGITPVARAGAVIGTILRPVTRNGYVYECTTLTGIIAGAQPTWPTVPGTSVTDADSNVWTCRNEHVVRGGGKGFTLGATCQTNGHYCQFIAYKTDKDRYLGDAADGDLSII